MPDIVLVRSWLTNIFVSNVRVCSCAYLGRLESSLVFLILYLHRTFAPQSWARTKQRVFVSLVCVYQAPSLFAYWLWSCVVTVLILLTKYWQPLVVTLLNYFLQTRSIPSACRICLHGWSKHFTSRYDPSTPFTYPPIHISFLTPHSTTYIPIHTFFACTQQVLIETFNLSLQKYFVRNQRQVLHVDFLGVVGPQRRLFTIF